MYMLELKQTRSLNNGLLSVLKLMQKKTQQMCLGIDTVGSLGVVSNARDFGSEVSNTVLQATAMETHGDARSGAGEKGSSTQVSMKSSIEKKLQEALAPSLLVVDDVSHQHAGHAGVEKGAKETHFNVRVISEKFTGTSLIKRHRLIYNLLDEELKNGVHALSLITKSPSEPI